MSDKKKRNCKTKNAEAKKCSPIKKAKNRCLNIFFADKSEMTQGRA